MVEHSLKAEPNCVRRVSTKLKVDSMVSAHQWNYVAFDFILIPKTNFGIQNKAQISYYGTTKLCCMSMKS